MRTSAILTTEVTESTEYRVRVDYLPLNLRFLKKRDGVLRFGFFLVLNAENFFEEWRGATALG
jgi:hypothetical protein